jgi:choline-sulfatase
MSFFEGSARVPLLIAAPTLGPRRIDVPVSTLDLAPTLADLAGIDLDEIRPWIDGRSLIGAAKGRVHGPVYMEYAAEGAREPIVALRQGRWKYVTSASDPALLFDLEADPLERSNLAGSSAGVDIEAQLRMLAGERWDLRRLDAEVRASQARRHVVYEALRNGAYYPWDFQPLQKASEQYMRNHLDLNRLEEARRYTRGE